MAGFIRSVHFLVAATCAVVTALTSGSVWAADAGNQKTFPLVIVSARSGAWSVPGTWQGGKVPTAGARVRIAEGHIVTYDVASDQVIRLLHVAGTLTFARDRNTRLDVGLIKIQAGADSSEDGFDCDLHVKAPDPKKPRPALEVGTPDEPIPAKYSAQIRLTYIPGMDRESCPAIVCCGGRMDLHGAPLSRTWLDLGKDVVTGDRGVTLAEAVKGWREGDRVIVTGSVHRRSQDTYRGNPDRLSTEVRRVGKIDGTTLTLDRPLDHPHRGSGLFRSEVANLSRNVIVESADPKGIRGHTMYHRHSAGSISYAEFRHLGKQAVLGRYSIHYHLVGDTMRGSSVIGASIWDSHNRWITIHGTNYLVVRDCVGYQSIGHGFFLEDGSEVYNVLDRNLGVQAYRGKPLPKQVLTFDPNDGAAFWWANGRNTLVRNTSCENDEYGFRFDSQKARGFNSELPVLMPDGSRQRVDIRLLPFYRFEDNEAHTEGLYGMVFAGPGLNAPDTRHPHILKNLTIWNVHYALRPQIPTMWIENVKINGATYGIYRAEVDHHVYRNIHLARVSNRAIGFAGRADGHGRGGIQQGSFSYDGVTFDNLRTKHPLICMNQTAVRQGVEAHFRNVTVKNSTSPLNVIDVQPTRGGEGGDGKNGPTYYFHDFFKKGEVIKVASTRYPELVKTGLGERKGFTGKQVLAADAGNVPFPRLLDPVDDLPPATVITSPAPGATVRLVNGKLIVRGTTTDNTRTRRVVVNGVEATSVDYNFHQWEVRLANVKPGLLTLTAQGEDPAKNVEKLPHRLSIRVK
jgi:G8 domain